MDRVQRMADDKRSPALPANQTETPPAAVDQTPRKPVEIGGPKGPEPTRYNDWEKGGRCIDF